ncbi:hypothetical protein K7432_013997 [Basidiobolus ranarum]|uniref:Yeast cell wall synthesis Kre9/Knh1-like N-terminal domain-containing protein n=1 Tax=Basidiobolus ranarum TaxID=34480 RepID=A0ABR2VQ14_9FUNG
MFCKSPLSIVLLALLSLASAEVSITHPVASSTWSRGEDATIEWSIDAADLAETITIELREGPKANLALAYTIAQDVDANEESHDWMVPMDLAPGDTYSIRVITNTGTDRYSHYFKIE